MNTFIMVRISFQFALGGYIQPKVRITQVLNNRSSVMVNLAFIVFLLYLVVQLYRVLRQIIRRAFSWRYLMATVMFSLNLAFAVFSFMRSDLLNAKLAEFEVDPRGKPDFEEIFIVQEKMISLVALASWFHTIYLIFVLSTLNDVWGKLDYKF